MTRTAKITLASSIMLLVVFLYTDPRALPSVALFVPFVLLFMAIFTGVLFVLGLYGMTRQSKLRLGLVAAAGPVLLLVLQSLGQLTVRDVFGIFALFCAAYFYISRLGVKQPN